MPSEDRVAWHSEHYRNDSRPQDPFKMLWFDALSEYPQGQSVPDVVRFALARPDLMVGLGSWCLSFGREQAERTDRFVGDDRAKYYDAAWRRAKGDPRRQIEAVLTERLHYYGVVMARKNVGQLVPTGKFDNVTKDSFYDIISGAAQAHRGRAPIYRRGSNPLKVKRYGTPGLVVYDPDTTDWDVRRNKLEARIIDLLNSGRPKVDDLRAALAETVRVLWQEEAPEPLNYVKRDTT